MVLCDGVRAVQRCRQNGSFVRFGRSLERKARMNETGEKRLQVGVAPASALDSIVRTPEECR